APALGKNSPAHPSIQRRPRDVDRRVREQRILHDQKDGERQGSTWPSHVQAQSPPVSKPWVVPEFILGAGTGLVLLELLGRGFLHGLIPLLELPILRQRGIRDERRAQRLPFASAVLGTRI